MSVQAYYEIGISRHHAGFGMYELGEHNYSSDSAWAELSDLEQAMIDGACGQLVPLAEALTDTDFLAAGVEDIRGKIYGGDPAYIYAIHLEDGEIAYSGISVAEVESNYWQSV